MSVAMLRVHVFSSMQAALSRCALAIAVGDPVHAQASAPTPSLAPTPAISPQQSLLLSEEDNEGLRFCFGSIRSSGVAQLLSAPVSPDAQ